MQRKRKALGDESLGWIDNTEESGELEVLKEYDSEEAEKKRHASDASSLFHDDTSTIVKKKKSDKHLEEKSEQPAPASGNESVVEEIKEEVEGIEEKIEDIREDIKEIEKIVSKKEEARNINTKKKKIPEKIAHEKLKAKTAGAIGTVKEKSTQALDAFSKTFGPGRLNVKKMMDSVVSACGQPLESLFSIDRNINKSAKKIMQFEDKNVIDKNVIKPIRNLDASINHEIKKLFRGILW